MYNLSVAPGVQLNATLENVPGALAMATKTLADASVNVVCFSQTAEGMGGTGQVRFVVDNQAAAEKALSSASITYVVEDVVIVTCPQNVAGTLAAIAKALGDAGINIQDLFYSSSASQANIVVCIQVSKENTAKAMEVVKAL